VIGLGLISLSLWERVGDREITLSRWERDGERE